MNKNKLKCRPILVESKDKITLNSIVKDPTFNLGIIIEKHGEECFYNTHSSGGPVITPWKRNLGNRLKHYELILISLEDEKIEVGDIYYNKSANNIGTAELNDEIWLKRFCKKIIARQSQISPEYISKFIEQYNNGYIEDLEIEMELIGHSVSLGIYNYEPRLDANGFVTSVEKSKEPILYTEEEVEELLIKATSRSYSTIQDVRNWFNQNKKK